MIKEPLITIPELVDPEVPGSGQYSATEALAYLDRRAALIAEQRGVIRRIVAIHEEAVAADVAKGDESPEVTAKIEEALLLSYQRLEREFKAAYSKSPDPPQAVRDGVLLNLLEFFDSYDVDKSGGLSLAESKLSREVYLKLSPSGELTREKIRAGISVRSRPAVKGER